jgi:hypothetical protein
VVGFREVRVVGLSGGSRIEPVLQHRMVFHAWK